MTKAAVIDVDHTLAQLSQTEKINLLTGHDFWHTFAVPRLGIPSIRMSDGPNGVRGQRFFNGTPSSCFPCATALASTFDRALLEDVGHAIARECISKGVHCWLAPTINTVRSPLGGRSYESFSEDPVLQGYLVAPLVAALQSHGVAATQKHFVGNEAELERMSSDSRIPEAALREIYLKPFEIICRGPSPPWCTMTAYNRVNGVHASESKRLLHDILRNEWGYDGLVMSDWYGTYSAGEAIQAGLDLEMPGPSTVRGLALSRALAGGKIRQSEIDERVRTVLTLVERLQRAGALFDQPERQADVEALRDILFRAAAQSIVLLKNDGDILPLADPDEADVDLAIIGPNAKCSSISGGGSASLLPSYAVSMYDGILAAIPESQRAKVAFAQGVYSHRYLPSILPLCRSPGADGREGCARIHFYNTPPPASGAAREEAVDGPPLATMHTSTHSMLFLDGTPEGVPLHAFTAEIETLFTPDESGEWEFGLTSAGLTRLYIDDDEVIDNATEQRPGTIFFTTGTLEETGRVHLQAGREYRVRISFDNAQPPGKASPFLGGGAVQFGACRVRTRQEMRDEAVKLARSRRDVVLCLGLSGEWESEGFDRSTLSLPPGSDELVEAVLDANPRTVVVLQCGSAVEMPWSHRARAVLQTWYGGNELGNALASLLFGRESPSGRLSLTFPVKSEDTPSHGNFPRSSHNGYHGVVEYKEGRRVGYRHYDAVKAEVLFPFGHGLSYSRFAWSGFSVSPRGERGGFTVHLTVRNEGNRPARETVQLYVVTPSLSPSSPSSSSSEGEGEDDTPPQELKQFHTTRHPLSPGAEESVTLELHEEDLATFSTLRGEWIVPKGKRELRLARSSRDIVATLFWEVEEERSFKTQDRGEGLASILNRRGDK